MKTVLVPVDFSDTSTNALAFAAELCVRASVHLIMVHVLPEGANEEEAKSRLLALETYLEKSFGPGLSYESLLTEGNLIAALEKIAAEWGADLVVMGTKGASGLKKILIGSNTVKVIANTSVPVFVIPEVAKFEDFNRHGKNRIILATDLELLENENAPAILKEIATYIVKPKVRVLNVRPKNTTLPDVKRMEREVLLSWFQPEIETERVTVFSDNVMSGINYYLSERSEDAGLLAMIARDTGQLIQRHYTREMASHTHLPLLVMHDSI